MYSERIWRRTPLCPENSVSFVFGVPQQLTFSQSADAMAGPSGAVYGERYFQGFLFFNDQYQLLSGANYSFTPGDLGPAGAPEPCTIAGASSSPLLVHSVNQTKQPYRGD
jgi:hypothetical protein